MTGPRNIAAFAAGAGVGTLGGLIGLGGAEFRLPILIGAFRFGPLEAVILNKATSLVVVASALAFRSETISFDLLAAHWSIIALLLAGSLAGAWLGASWATRMPAATLHRVIAVMLVLIAAVLLFAHDPQSNDEPLLSGHIGMAVGVVAGFAIGIVAALLGVAGGELLIPTIMLLFGADIRLAGSLALAVSLPTMIVGFARYSRDRSFLVLRDQREFALWLATGSVAGAFVGALLLGVAPSAWLVPLLAAILLLSAVKVWRHA